MAGLYGTLFPDFRIPPCSIKFGLTLWNTLPALSDPPPCSIKIVVPILNLYGTRINFLSPPPPLQGGGGATQTVLFRAWESESVGLNQTQV